jgi:hypothetical protein
MPLAKPGDPYVSETGQILLPGDHPTDAIPRNATLGAPVAKNVVSTERRTIKELPSDPRTQTVINAVLVYQLLGMTDNEISHITTLTIEDIQRLKQLHEYQETFDILFHQFISVNSTSLQSKIASFAGEALDNMINIAGHSKHEMAKLKANQDILDRAGLHPETLFGKNKQDDGFESLKIVIQDGKDDERMKVDINLDRRK